MSVPIAFEEILCEITLLLYDIFLDFDVFHEVHRDLNKN
jgi:hypothetical protein